MVGELQEEQFEFTADSLEEEIDKLDKAESVALREKFQRHYDGFWEFQKYMDSSAKSGYSDEQIDVKLVAYGMYLVIWGYITKFVLSMPRRRRKSHAVNDAVKYVVGFMPNRSNARYSYSGDLVKFHSKIIRGEIQSEKFRNVFPKVKLKPDSRSASDWQVTQCTGNPTFHCAGIDGASTGLGVDKLLIADDLVKDWKSSQSVTDRASRKSFLAGNFESGEEAGMCTLHIATRWADDDPPGEFIRDALINGHQIFKFDAYYDELSNENITKFIDSVIDAKPTENDVLWITIPALNVKEETTCPYHEKYTTNFYKNVKKKRENKGEHHIWYSIYQQTPRIQGSMLFSDFNNWYQIKDIGDLKFSGGVSHLDPAGKGRNNTCIGLARTLGDNVYIMPDIVYTPERPSESKIEVINFLKRRHKYIDILTGEGNGGGDQYCESVNGKLDESNDIEIRINIENTDQNKELKIFLNSDWINKHVFLPAEFDDDGNRQYAIDSPMDRCIKALTKYVGKVEGSFVRNQEDDFLDFLCGVKDIIYDSGEDVEIGWV